MAECNHNCAVTEEVLKDVDGSHYLDCPVWKEILSRTGTKVGLVWPYNIQPAPEGSRRRRRSEKRLARLIRRMSK